MLYLLFYRLEDNMLKDREGDIVLRICDVCGHEQWVNYWNAYRKERHLCRHCNNREIGAGRRGKFTAHNKGQKRQPKALGNFYINSSGYVEVWIGKHTQKDKAGGYYREHRLMIELSIGRKLADKEIIHHVDGDKTNNLLSNLHLCEDDKHHRNIHGQLERIAMELVRNGAIKFDNKSGIYHIDPYVREFVSKSLELLENPETGNQQRSLRDQDEEERSTTIQKWSTLQAIGSGSGGQLEDDFQVDDIVCSA